MKDGARLLALVIGFWLLMAGLFVAGTGAIPSTAGGWVLLILFGPVGYMVASALGEAGMERLSSLAKHLGLGRTGRIALLLFVLVPALALLAYLTI